MISHVEATLAMLKVEADALSRRAIHEDRAELIADVQELVLLTERLSKTFSMPSPIDSTSYVRDLKKRFLLATTNHLVAGIFAEDAVASPIDPTPIRRHSHWRLGIGLAEHREQKVAIDAPCYHADRPCFGFIVPARPQDEWVMVREAGDISYVMMLEHEWISGYGVDLVVVRDVLGVGREALRMADEARPGLLACVDEVREIFFHRFGELSEPAEGIPGFYHFGTGKFSPQPWGA